MNAQVAEYGFDCWDPQLFRSDIDREMTHQHYYGPSLPVHFQREYINYWSRVRDIRPICGWTRPQSVEDAYSRTFWQTTRRVFLRPEFDNQLMLQVTLRKKYDDFVEYGEEASGAYFLPAFEYRLFQKLPADSDDWRLAGQGERLVHQGTAVAKKTGHFNVDGDPIFDVVIRFPREAVNTSEHWLLLSPRVEMVDEAFNSAHLAMNPNDESLKITAFKHEVPGLFVHVVAPMNREKTWGDVRRHLVDAFHNHQTDRVDVQALTALATGIQTIDVEGTELRIAVVNRTEEWTAELDAAWVQNQNVDAVLILTRRGEEVVSLVNETITCDDFPCDWYVTDDNTATGARSYLAGDFFRGRFQFDLTETPVNGGLDWVRPTSEHESFWTEFFEGSFGALRSVDSLFDAAGLFFFDYQQNVFSDMTFEPLGTQDAVFKHYGIEVKCRAGGRHKPLWELRVNRSELALADGVAVGDTWDARRQGVYLDGDLLAERISTDWDVDGKAIPPANFMENGDPRKTGTIGGSKMVDKLVEFNRENDKIRFKELIKPTRFANVLDGVLARGTKVIAVGGLLLGGGMMMTYSVDEDGFWEGGVLAGQSAFDLYAGSRAATASANMLRAKNLADYNKFLTQSGKWVRASVWVGAAAERSPWRACTQSKCPEPKTHFSNDATVKRLLRA